MKQAIYINEKGKREVLTWLANTLKESQLPFIYSWMDDVCFFCDNLGHIEVGRHFTASRNPATYRLSEDCFDFKEVDE